MIDLSWDNLPDTTQDDILSHLCAHCPIARREEGELTCPFFLDPMSGRCPYGEDFLTDLDSTLDNMGADLERYVNSWI